MEEEGVGSGGEMVEGEVVVKLLQDRREGKRGRGERRRVREDFMK